jgi:hypothetical protein
VQWDRPPCRALCSAVFSASGCTLKVTAGLSFSTLKLPSLRFLSRQHRAFVRTSRLCGRPLARCMPMVQVRIGRVRTSEPDGLSFPLCDAAVLVVISHRTGDFALRRSTCGPERVRRGEWDMNQRVLFSLGSRIFTDLNVRGISCRVQINGVNTTSERGNGDSPSCNHFRKNPLSQILPSPSQFR